MRHGDSMIMPFGGTDRLRTPQGRGGDRPLSTWPADVREFVPEAELTQEIANSAREMSAAERGHTPAWEILLAVLTYSYATGTYTSVEIEDRLLQNSQSAEHHMSVFGFASPAAVLRGFRRTNRNAVEVCLTNALQHVQTNILSSFFPAGRQEAAYRVQRAIELDSIVQDF